MLMQTGQRGQTVCDSLYQWAYHQYRPLGASKKVPLRHYRCWPQFGITFTLCEDYIGSYRHQSLLSSLYIRARHFHFLKEPCMLGGRPGHAEGIPLIGFSVGLRYWKAHVCMLLLVVKVSCPVCSTTASSSPWMIPWLEGNLIPLKFSTSLLRRARRLRWLVLRAALHAAEMPRAFLHGHQM